MADSMPLASVIIPVYNCERYLAEAIDSALAQTYRPFEVIVVDDGSTDGSAGVAQSYGSPVQCHSQPNAGVGPARNLGVRLSKGPLLAFLDADDLWTPEKLARQVAALKEDPSLDMVFGHTRQFHSPDLDESVKATMGYAREVMPGNLAGACLVRRDAFLRAGWFEAGWRVGEFMEWYLRSQDKGLKSRMLPEVVHLRRLHGGNLGVRERAHQADYARILKASLDRRRRAGQP